MTPCHGREWGNTSGEKGRERNRKGGNYSREGRVEPGKPIKTRVDTRIEPNRTTQYRRKSEKKNPSETGDPETPSKDREGVHLRGEREGPEERKPLKGKTGGTGQRPKGSREPGAKGRPGCDPFSLANGAEVEATCAQALVWTGVGTGSGAGVCVQLYLYICCDRNRCRL